ncbi:DNA-binding transcriptional regulator, HxlR family [Nonomuraea maritima]|uniref:DNA-binding transcriptional regulator, HxlR family n=1 Tax=Nonomuraea maritima TaxID=683260 RepID=A0A1G8Z1N5_9ACTN|nr:helix-turn-helix domain-containing protein [Nonomuraea maritima]SDK08160.1 DNA-binding transcriptional regulator, HxlR family [Nonomuraea maritima]
MPKTLGRDSTCSIARSLEILGDAWTLLIVREALVAGSTRFQEFQEALGTAPNILSKRLAALVDEGLMLRRAYQEPGTRPRDEYVLTEAGRSLAVVIAALAEWGREHRPRPDGTSPRFVTDDARTADLAFVTADGHRIPASTLTAHRISDH